MDLASLFNLPAHCYICRIRVKKTSEMSPFTRSLYESVDLLLNTNFINQKTKCEHQLMYNNIIILLRSIHSLLRKMHFDLLKLLSSSSFVKLAKSFWVAQPPKRPQ